MSIKYNIGIDIGGTKVNIGIIKENGQVVRKCRVSSDIELNPSTFIQQIVAALRNLLLEANCCLDDIHSIGVGVPGTADNQTGIVTYCPNLYWYDVPVGQLFRQELGRDVIVCQDTWNAALAEARFGAGRNFKELICLSIGTGIGGGMIHEGKIFSGFSNTAGEIGHMSVERNGRKCVCGNDGCLEQYVSGKSMIIRANELFPEKFVGLELKTETLFYLAKAGDQELLAFIDDCVDYLGFALANSVNVFAPEAIIISGGLCVHHDLIIKPLRDKIFAHGYYSWKSKDTLQVFAAELGSDAPMIGASILYQGI